MYTFNKDTLDLEVKFNLSAAYVDFKGRLKLSSLVDFFIQAAVFSADELKLGLEDVHRQKSFWVLSRLEVEIFKTGQWYDTLKVVTWPKGNKGLLYLRDFLAYDQHGDLVAKSTSAWLAIDLVSKRPRLISHGVQSELNENEARHALEALPTKIPAVGEVHSLSKKACYSDLDFNNHVTSHRYVEWIMDTIPFDVIKERYPSKLAINYLKETKVGDTINLGFEQNKDAFTVEARNESLDVPAFRGIVTF